MVGVKVCGYRNFFSLSSHTDLNGSMPTPRCLMNFLPRISFWFWDGQRVNISEGLIRFQAHHLEKKISIIGFQLVFHGKNFLHLRV
jgi:hypothetical protein